MYSYVQITGTRTISLSVASSLVLPAFHWPRWQSIFQVSQKESFKSGHIIPLVEASTAPISHTHTEVCLRHCPRDPAGSGPCGHSDPFSHTPPHPLSSSHTGFLTAPCSTASHGACVLCLGRAASDVLLGSSRTSRRSWLQ